MFSTLGQQIRRFREGIESTRRELEAQLAAVHAQSRRAGVGGLGLNPLQYNHQNLTVQNPGQFFTNNQQFEAAAIQNNCTPNEEAVHLLNELQSKAADILHTVTAEAKYEDIVGALQDSFGDQ